ncbi:hypothetical protein FHE72_23635 (plasmid) [Rossellomorea vietnamensis]|uniref:Uncharacterized protein n=1 Tax=Rossellomorea vietnamensis TaxID=218284 RepID=A0A6I6UXM4_9BACI|nr:hypothetical protein [Rossellomorea vietnamensis]QHE63986.1 hypothetical protein FHE72_23635 [Rossellomorea vietnamensis]
MGYKIFKFEHSEGAEIVAAENAKDAINFYFNNYQDDSQIDDIVEYDGIEIEELQGEDIKKKHEIHNEETGKSEEVSYRELAERFYKGEPEILVMPRY